MPAPTSRGGERTGGGSPARVPHPPGAVGRPGSEGMVGGLGSRDCVGPGGPGGLPGNGGRRPARRLSLGLSSPLSSLTPAQQHPQTIEYPHLLLWLRPAPSPPTCPSPQDSAEKRQGEASIWGGARPRRLQPLPQPGCVPSAASWAALLPRRGAELGCERLLLSLLLLPSCSGRPGPGASHRQWECRGTGSRVP